MGAGSGIQAVVASGKKSVKSVLAVDIDSDVIEHCLKTIKNPKISFVHSDLFCNVPDEVFDTIIFNPPYLPQELPQRDVALEGGKQGYETIIAFLKSAGRYLSANGQVLLLFSSLSRKNRVEEALARFLLDYEELGRLHVFFEDLYVYRITKNSLAKGLEKKGIKKAEYAAKGRRGLVYRGNYRGRIVAIKTKRPGTVTKPVVNEAKALRIANKLGLGPKLFFATNEFVVYEWVDGSYFGDALLKADKKTKKSLFKQLFLQAFVLDKAGLAKEEMLRPLKNAVVTPKNKVVLIDFERLHKTKKPNNVTQLCTFAAKEGIAPLKTIRHLAKHYKQNQTRGNFNSLLRGAGL
jgi:HemK-related putative methylase